MPCYWIFDNDKREDKKQAENKAANRLLQRLASKSEESCEDWPEGVFGKFACWDHKIEKYVSLKAGQQKFDAARKEFAENFNVDESVALKFPASSSAILLRLREQGVKFDELDQIVQAIDQIPLTS